MKCDEACDIALVVCALVLEAPEFLHLDEIVSSCLLASSPVCFGRVEDDLNDRRPDAGRVQALAGVPGSSEGIADDIISVNRAAKGSFRGSVHGVLQALTECSEAGYEALGQFFQSECCIRNSICHVTLPSVTLLCDFCNVHAQNDKKESETHRTRFGRARAVCIRWGKRPGTTQGHDIR